MCPIISFECFRQKTLQNNWNLIKYLNLFYIILVNDLPFVQKFQDKLVNFIDSAIKRI